MFLFAWRRSGNENDSESDNAVENGRDYSNFRVFYRSIFSTILVPGTGFFRLEGILGVRWAEKKILQHPTRTVCKLRLMVHLY